MSLVAILSNETVSIPNTYLAKFTDADLAALRQIADERILPQANALGACLCWNLECEAERRRRAERGDMIEPRPMIVQLGLWSDVDVGVAVEVSEAFSLGSHEGPVGDFFDELSVFCVQVAADRLRHSGDLRNGVPYADRHEKGFCR